MKSVLITGGAGFIGYNLSKKLLEQGNVVISIDNFITSRSENIINLKKNDNYYFFGYDINNPIDFLHKKFGYIDEIYHLACPTGVPNLIVLAEEMLLTCSLGTKNILEFTKKYGGRLLFTSSSEVYGDPHVFPQNEKYTGNVSTTGLRSPYEEGKRFSESLISMYVRKYGIDAKIVRVFNTYGPGMSDFDSRVIPRLMKEAILKKPLIIYNNGHQTRTFCYIDDLIDGLRLIQQKGEKGEVYNLGSKTKLSIIQLAKLIIQITLSDNNVKFIKGFIEDHNGRFPDLKKVTDLGWVEKTSLKEGLLKTMRYLKNRSKDNKNYKTVNDYDHNLLHYYIGQEN